MPTTYHSNVLFCGENPGISLYRPETSDLVALASYWRCAYSAQGEGDALILWVAPGAGAGEQGVRAIYADNEPMARFVSDAINQYFGGYNTLDLPNVPVETARFSQESAGDRHYRAVCYVGERLIELDWQDVQSRQLMVSTDRPFGERNFNVASVLCPCAGASITIDGQRVNGVVNPSERDGRPWSSAFLAFAESWTENK